MGSLLILLVGFVEWALALLRTQSCASGKRLQTSLLVFAEQVLGLLVLRSVVVSDDWGLVVIYAFGGALGALWSVIPPKGKTPKAD